MASVILVCAAALLALLSLLGVPRESKLLSAAVILLCGAMVVARL